MQHNYCKKGCNQSHTEIIETYKNIEVTKLRLLNTFKKCSFGSLYLFVYMFTLSNPI